MAKFPDYGDYLTIQGKSFRFVEMYQGDDWPHSRCVAEAVDPDIDAFAPDSPWRQLYAGSDYFLLWIEDCEIVTAKAPQTFQGEGI